MFIVFALICEIIRWVFAKEIFLRNVYIVILGSVLGCWIHPNFPNNLISFHLNAILVPFYSLMNAGIILGKELYSSPARFIFINNFTIFFTLNVILWMVFINRIKIGFSTLVWWACTSIYLTLAFISDKNWYISNVLFCIFFASFLHDWIDEQGRNSMLPKINKLFIIYVIIILFSAPSNIKVIKNSIARDIQVNTHYENVASWMQNHIPKGETIYHANGSDSAFFLCLNPDNDYLLFLDPIYMFYRYPEVYVVYINLREGKIDKPYEALKRIFNVRYGYTRKNNLLYNQIKQDAFHFHIILRMSWGLFLKF